MKTSLAHVADPHLGPPPKMRRKDFGAKRLSGRISYAISRRRKHLRSVADDLADDVAAADVNHVAVVGDLVNFALPSEFNDAAKWLARFGEPSNVSTIPGNHDVYVPTSMSESTSESMSESFAALRDYMTPSLIFPDVDVVRWEALQGAARDDLSPPLCFPYVRRSGSTALIGLSSAIPRPPMSASGRLGDLQLAALDALLRTLGDKGFFRVVMVHHPPLPGDERRRRALRDAEALRDVVVDAGAEMIIHGHAHRLRHDSVTRKDGQTAEIIGLPSASSTSNDDQRRAMWARYDIERRDRKWRCEASFRARSSDGVFAETRRLALEWGGASS